MKTALHREGATRLVVPAASLTQNPPPTSPVFFNPAASLNRDVTVAVTKAFEGESFCDAMSGIGARGIRVANEARNIVRVVMVDFNKGAVSMARRAAKLNGVSRKCEFSVSETSAYLYSRYGRERRFDFVDLDPFGSPVRQLQAALSATADEGMLSITATDTAVLCGVYPKVCWRRYGALPINNSFHHETGLRILAANVVRQAAQLDIGVVPVLAHSTRHYARLYVKIHAGADNADRAVERLGYISECGSCGHLTAQETAQSSCPRCGSRARSAGPLWLGGLVDDGLAEASAKVASKMSLDSAAAVLESLAQVDRFPPWSVDLEEVCSSLRIPSVPEGELRARLEGNGYRTIRQPFEQRGLKTDADVEAVKEAVRDTHLTTRVSRTAVGVRAQGRSAAHRRSNTAPN